MAGQGDRPDHEGKDKGQFHGDNVPWIWRPPQVSTSAQFFQRRGRGSRSAQSADGNVQGRWTWHRNSRLRYGSARHCGWGRSGHGRRWLPNQLWTLLGDRMGRVPTRRTLRVSNAPRLAREVTSGYRRRQRAKRRRARRRRELQHNRRRLVTAVSTSALTCGWRTLCGHLGTLSGWARKGPPVCYRIRRWCQGRNHDHSSSMHGYRTRSRTRCHPVAEALMVRTHCMRGALLA